MDKSARADLSLPANEVRHDAEYLVCEVAIAEDIALAEAGCED